MDGWAGASPPISQDLSTVRCSSGVRQVLAFPPFASTIFFVGVTIRELKRCVNQETSFVTISPMLNMKDLENYEEQAFIKKGTERIEESAIDTASSSLNDLVYSYCGSVCFLGECEKQIQFEVKEESTPTYDPLLQLFKRMRNNEEVQASRQLLFDEESVVVEVSSRSGL